MTRADRKRAGLPVERLGRSFIGLDPAVVEDVLRHQSAEDARQQLFLQELVKAEQAQQERLRSRLTSVENDLRVEEAQAAHLESAAKLADDTGEIIREAVQRYLNVLEGEAAERRSGLEMRVSELRDQVRQSIRQLELAAEQMGALKGGDRSGLMAGFPGSIGLNPATSLVPPVPAIRRSESPPDVPPPSPLRAPATVQSPAADRSPADQRSNPGSGGRVVLFRAASAHENEPDTEPRPAEPELAGRERSDEPPAAGYLPVSPAYQSFGRSAATDFTEGSDTRGEEPPALFPVPPIPTTDERLEGDPKPAVPAATSPPVRMRAPPPALEDSHATTVPVSAGPARTSLFATASPAEPETAAPPGVAPRSAAAGAPEGDAPVEAVPAAATAVSAPSAPGGDAPPKIAQPAPAPSAAQMAAGIKGRLALSMARLLDGKVVGTDLRDDGGNLVAARGTPITSEVTAKAEAAGLLPDLILHMVWPEEVEA